MRSSPRGPVPRRPSPILKAPAYLGDPVDLPQVQAGTETGTRSRMHLAVPEHLLALARQSAADLLTEAQQEARRLKEEAAAKGREEGRREGYAEGVARGHEDGLVEGRRAAEELLRAARSQAADLVASQEEKIAQLSLEVAAHLLGMELTLNPEAVEQVVLATLRESDDTEVEIGVAADDYTQALKACRAWQEAVGGGAEIHIVVDPDVPRGGCRVRGPHGIVDRNWQREILAISDVFEEVARRGL